MTISATTSRGDFTANGTTGPYTIPFPLYSQADLKVIVSDASTNIDTVQVLTADYTFTSFTQDNTGQCASPQITFVSAVPSGNHIAVILNPPGTQLTDIKNQGTFFASSHEVEMDKLALKDLSIQNSILGAVRIPLSEDPASFTMTLPRKALRLNQVLATDQNGNLTLLSYSTANQVLAYVNKEINGFAPTGTGQWGLAACSLVLPAGTWELSGFIETTNIDTLLKWAICAADGANTGTRPALITNSSDVALKMGGSLVLQPSGITNASGVITVAVPNIVLALKAQVTVYLVPFASYTLSTPTIGLGFYAKQISAATT